MKKLKKSEKIPSDAETVVFQHSDEYSGAVVVLTSMINHAKYARTVACETRQPVAAYNLRRVEEIMAKNLSVEERNSAFRGIEFTFLPGSRLPSEELAEPKS